MRHDQWKYSINVYFIVEDEQQVVPKYSIQPDIFQPTSKFELFFIYILNFSI